MANCCHPILAWLLQFFGAIVTGCLCIITFFSCVTARPRTHMVPNGDGLEFTTAENVTVAHLGFSYLSVVLLYTTLKLINDGDYRDDWYHLETEYKVLNFCVFLTAIVNCALGIWLQMLREDLFNFPETPVDKAHLWWFGTSAPQATKELRYTRTKVIVTTICALDAVCLILCFAGTVFVVGCMQREKYYIETLSSQRPLLRTQLYSKHKGHVSSHHSMEAL